MKPMTPPVRSMLLDTNVWLDWYLATRSRHESALELLRRANARDVTLLHAVSSTKDVFFLVGMDFKRAARQREGGRLTQADADIANRFAWACLENMQEVSTAVGCDHSDVWLASKQRRLHADYEDDLIIAAAMRSKASLLVTNDEELLRHSPVATLTVEDALKLLS